MLTRDFGKVIDVCPDVESTVRMIEEFLRSIPALDHLEPERISRRYPALQAVYLYRALEVAVDQGLLKRSWGVLSPTNHTHALGYWDTIAAIPQILHDTGDYRFDRDDGELIVVYRSPEARDSE